MKSISCVRGWLFLAVAWSGQGCGQESASAGSDALTDVGGEDTAVSMDAAADVPSDAAGDVPAVVDEAPLAHAVDPFIGSSYTGGNVGSAYPSATRPWGLCKVGPDTQNEGGAVGALHCAGYQYADPFTYGITHNRLQGTGAPDYGNLAVMPFSQITSASTTRKGRLSTYDHAGEEAEPGYYAVTLGTPHVRAEVTATVRCAHHRYTFLEDDASGGILVDLATSIAKGRVGAAEVQWDLKTQGLRGKLRNLGDFSDRYGGFDVYFEARFDRPWTTNGTWNDGVIQPSSQSTQTVADPANIGAWATFDLAKSKSVELQLCMSYVSGEGAKKALTAELPKFDFAATRREGLLEWQKALSVIEIDAPNDTERTLFYSSLYRVMQMPTIWNDVDFSYRGFDGQVHQTGGWNYVTDLSLWDTFRTQNPLIVLLWPTMARDVLRSLSAQTVQGKKPPQWSMGMGDTGSMIGYHSASVAADGWVKGVRDFDLAPLYAGLNKQADSPQSNMECMDDFLSQGWCAKPHAKGSVSLTLEYAYDDYCLSILAEALALPDDVTKYAARAQNWTHHWDPATQFFRAKNEDGTFTTPFDAEFWSFSNDEYVEGSAWQWNWFVPHDVNGLVAIYPSKDAFLQKLTTFFQSSADSFNFIFPNGFYFHGNEPDILASTLFSAVGHPELSDKWTRWIADSCYTTAPDGLVGNDDAGTLSAWYVLAALGIMPRPGIAGYDVIQPRYDHATVHLPTGDWQIDAPGAYAKQAPAGLNVDGVARDSRWITHAELLAGKKVLWK